MKNPVHPFSKNHYVIAQVLEPRLWVSHNIEQIEWCLKHNINFSKHSTYFGVTIWYKREQSLIKSDEILNALEALD